MVPFVESCPLFRPALAMFPLPLLLLLMAPLAVLLLLHCLSTAPVGVLEVLGVTGADTKSKKSPLLISSERNAVSPMSIAVTGEVATKTLLVAEDAISAPAVDDIPTTRDPRKWKRSADQV